MGQIIFIIARESVEALLVIGILWAWLNKTDPKRGKKYLLGGVLAGLGLALLLAFSLAEIGRTLGENAQTYFTIAMLLVATGLIIQMVWWMRCHARTLRVDLESRLDEKVAYNNWWGVLVLCALAVGREGSETVIFLYGSFIGLDSLSSHACFFGAVAVGLGIAFGIFYLMQLGSRFISWRIFFKITEILLLFFGSALFLTAMEQLQIALSSIDLPNIFYKSIFNISDIFSDGSTFGGILASLFAYRSQPTILDAIFLGLYWILVFYILRRRAN